MFINGLYKHFIPVFFPVVGGLGGGCPFPGKMNYI